LLVDGHRLNDPLYDTAAAATRIKSGEHASKAKVDYKPRASDPAPSAAAPPAPAVYENYQAH